MMTRYRNGGRTKISDVAMLWILYAFIAYPIEALRLQFWATRQGHTFMESLTVWLWRRTVDVWNSL